MVEIITIRINGPSVIGNHTPQNKTLGGSKKSTLISFSERKLFLL